MTHAEHLILVGVCGAIAGLCAGIAVHDFSMMAHAGERYTCKDHPDTKAYMARLPGESHSVERCVQVMRFSSPNWIPEFQHPLRPKQEGK